MRSVATVVLSISNTFVQTALLRQWRGLLSIGPTLDCVFLSLKTRLKMEEH